MKAIWNNAVITESNDTILLEGNRYFPFDSINQEFYAKACTLPVTGKSTNKARCLPILEKSRYVY